MNPRRVIPTVVVLASVGALTAVTIPAFAGNDRTPSPSPLDPPTVEAELSPELLAALQRDLGLSPEQALARVRTEAWATQTTAALREELGTERYAGAWLTEDAEALTVAVTDQDAAAQVRAAGAEPALVSYGERELTQVKTTLDRHGDEAADPVSGWYVDVSSNTVVVLAPDWAEAEARRFAVDSGVGGDAVRVVASDEQPQLLEDVRGGDAYIINNRSRCSIGFSVVGGFVTAGHCALAGVTTSGIDGLPQGEFVAASFPGVGENGPDDWGVVAVNEDWIPQPLVNDFEGGVLPVAGSEEAPVGAAVCKYGSTTGVSCGLILAKNATVVYPEGLVTGLTRSDACAEPGDSGGAWLAGDQAQGMTSGGSGDCTSGGVTFFQPLNEVLELNELTLVTSDGAGSDDSGSDGAGSDDAGAPPADAAEPAPPATSGCDTQDHTFRGQLAEAGTAQVQPNGRFYRALAAGTHTVCLAGPRQSDFDLILQRWNGQSFQTIADSAGVTSNELVIFHGEAGFYRIAVTSSSGTGSYLVGLSFSAR